MRVCGPAAQDVQVSACDYVRSSHKRLGSRVCLR